MEKLELALRNLNEDTKKEILDFAEMCRDLNSLINRENTLILDKGSVAFDGMFIRKINMLEKFEDDIRNVLSLAKKEAPDNLHLRKILVELIQDVRRSLSINTTFQLRDLKKRTKRMALLKDTLLDYSKQSDEGDTVCH